MKEYKIRIDDAAAKFYETIETHQLHIVLFLRCKLIRLYITNY